MTHKILPDRTPKHGPWIVAAGTALVLFTMAAIVGRDRIVAFVSVSSGATAVPSERVDAHEESAGGSPAWSIDTADLVSMEAVQAWIDAGVAGEAADQLGLDLREILISILSNDFDIYNDMMKKRGATLSTAAAALADHLRKFGYRDVESSAWDAMSVEDRLRYMWAHPSPRAAAWSSVDSRRVTAGTGWRLGPAESSRSFSGQLSLYDFPGRTDLLRGAQQDGSSSAWVQMPVVFNGALDREVRMTFLFSVETGRWYPARMESIGKGTTPALLF